MLCAYTRPRYQMSVFQDHWSSGFKFMSLGCLQELVKKKIKAKRHPS